MYGKENKGTDDEEDKDGGKGGRRIEEGSRNLIKGKEGEKWRVSDEPDRDEGERERERARVGARVVNGVVLKAIIDEIRGFKSYPTRGTSKRLQYLRPAHSESD